LLHFAGLIKHIEADRTGFEQKNSENYDWYDFNGHFVAVSVDGQPNRSI
jgi:hypothetical protein